MTTDPHSAAAHYERLLAEHYTWMLGDYDQAVAAQRALFAQLGVPRADGQANALDLGAGSGVQSVALAELGYAVTAVDSSESLLRELESRSRAHEITIVHGDLRDVTSLSSVPARGFDLAICMGDTLTHLESRNDVVRLFGDVRGVLAHQGRFVITYRDLTAELTGLDRFIPVRSDDDRVMTCFLEYDDAQGETVLVNDLVYVRDGGRWTLRTSSYRKLRLAVDWVTEQLGAAGFDVTYCGPAGRLTGIVAVRRD